MKIDGEGELLRIFIGESDRWHGKPLYQSYLIASADRKVDDWTGLKGDVHAFSDPDSNFGFLVTRAALAERHLRPETFFAKTFLRMDIVM